MTVGRFARDDELLRASPSSDVLMCCGRDVIRFPSMIYTGGLICGLFQTSENYSEVEEKIEDCVFVDRRSMICRLKIEKLVQAEIVE